MVPDASVDVGAATRGACLATKGAGTSMCLITYVRAFRWWGGRAFLATTAVDRKTTPRLTRIYVRQARPRLYHMASHIEHAFGCF